MKFVLGGNTFDIKNLDSSLDQAFIDLHAAYFSNLPYSWDTFSQIAYKFLDVHKMDTSFHDDFFTNFYY